MACGSRYLYGVFTSSQLLDDDLRQSAKRMVICHLVCPGKEVISTSPRVLLILAPRQHNDARSASIIIAITNSAQVEKDKRRDCEYLDPPTCRQITGQKW